MNLGPQITYMYMYGTCTCCTNQHKLSSVSPGAHSAMARVEPLLNSTPPDDTLAMSEVDPATLDLSPKPTSGSGAGGWQGSRWGTVFNMCSAILGAGALALPRAMSAMGLVPGVILLVLTACATHYSIVLLVSACVATGTESFEDLTRHVFGRWNGRLVELSIIVFQYGTLVAYTVAIGDILQPIVELQSVAERFPWLTRDVVIVLFWSVLMLPLSFVERVSSLQCTSLFGVLALIYLVAAVATHFAIDAAVDPSGTLGRLRLVSLTADGVSASAIVMFAFTCQVNVPSLYAALQTRTPGEMAAVSRRATALCLACYLLVGFCGYADFPARDPFPGNLLKNYCLVSPDHSSRAPSGHTPRVMTAAYVAITLTIVMAYPVNVFPTRYTLQGVLSASLGERYKTARHVGLTLAIASLTLVNALVVPDISDIFSLMGGTASAYVCYIIPAAAAWRLDRRLPQNRSALGRVGCAALFLFGALVGLLSTGTTIAGFFTPSPPAIDACNATALAAALAAAD